MSCQQKSRRCWGKYFLSNWLSKASALLWTDIHLLCIWSLLYGMLLWCATVWYPYLYIEWQKWKSKNETELFYNHISICDNYLQWIPLETLMSIKIFNNLNKFSNLDDTKRLGASGITFYLHYPSSSSFLREGMRIRFLWNTRVLSDDKKASLLSYSNFLDSLHWHRFIWHLNKATRELFESSYTSMTVLWITRLPNM